MDRNTIISLYTSEKQHVTDLLVNNAVRSCGIVTFEEKHYTIAPGPMSWDHLHFWETEIFVARR